MFLPIAMDRKIYRFIKRSGAFYCNVHDSRASEHNGERLGTSNFNTVGCRKMEIVLGALKLGYDVIFSDIDIVMMQDPLPYVFIKGMDYVHSQKQLMRGRVALH